MPDNKKQLPDKDQVRAALSNVMDPELHISLVDLGLIYEINIDDAKESVEIVMTLTSLGCPLFDQIKSDIISHIMSLGFKEKKIDIDLVFDPPWNMEMLSERAKAMIGI